MPDNMVEAMFYAVPAGASRALVPTLLQQCRARDWRVSMRLKTEELAQWDSWLWEYEKLSFLPHGAKGDKSPEQQPIWLTDEDEVPNNAQALLCLDESASITTKDFARCIYVLEGKNAAALAQAHWTHHQVLGDALQWIERVSGKWQTSKELPQQIGEPQ